MVHPCAACSLRFASSGELRDHIANDHVVPRPVEPETAHARHHHPHVLRPESYTRSGWVAPEPAPEHRDG